MPDHVIYLDELVDFIETKKKILLRADQIAPLADQIEAACLTRGRRQTVSILSISGPNSPARNLLFFHVGGDD